MLHQMRLARRMTPSAPIRPTSYVTVMRGLAAAPLSAWRGVSIASHLVVVPLSLRKKILRACVLDHMIAVAAVRLLLLLTAYRSGDAETLIGRQTPALHLWCH